MKKYSALSLEYGPVILVINDNDISILKNEKELFHTSNENTYKETLFYFEFYNTDKYFCKILKNSLLLQSS